MCSGSCNWFVLIFFQGVAPSLAIDAVFTMRKYLTACLDMLLIRCYWYLWCYLHVTQPQTLVVHHTLLLIMLSMFFFASILPLVILVVRKRDSLSGHFLWFLYFCSSPITEPCGTPYSIVNTIHVLQVILLLVILVMRKLVKFTIELYYQTGKVLSAMWPNNRTLWYTTFYC